MADMFDSGINCHEAWKRGASHVVRYLGEYNLNMETDEVERRLDYKGKISKEGLIMFRRGWASVGANPSTKQAGGRQ